MKNHARDGATAQWGRSEHALSTPAVTIHDAVQLPTDDPMHPSTATTVITPKAARDCHIGFHAEQNDGCQPRPARLVDAGDSPIAPIAPPISRQLPDAPSCTVAVNGQLAPSKPPCIMPASECMSSSRTQKKGRCSRDCIVM
ncbi:hypothetical protein GGTG_01954 [Gaeumannomyces tritici R3-111a-1]|uniref:Uncharacterized protein n=1 Tax=Gaeumannomyces tritici (strain R3-111a-1) TaxID=644352 RepID=J3NL13_GAET3|nr:hypothetical protein GGTG_01954 [Gaeumannomyces tritici R3-111a-1]EJT81980.1 hypothetical protein GGTG_01954 [Gaeumannomyces tritici R3-111a-1]